MNAHENSNGKSKDSESASAPEIEKLAREMDIAAPAGASGFAYWMGAGMRLRDGLMERSLSMHRELGYQQVKSPSMAPSELFARSGHLDKYGKLMFEARCADGSEGLMLRPMSCPNHLGIYALRRRSIAELPWRVFEFGEVFRNEPSGSLAFLLRQRQFVQDDAHVVCRLSQVAKLAEGWLSMAKAACEWMDCGSPELRLALRPERRLGSDAQWDESESRLAARLEASGMPWSPAPGEGAFYGPKIELALRDRLGRSWQMGVFQLDLNLPGLFGLSADGLEQGEDLALVHHAVFGSIERAAGVMLACRGKDLPPWAHPNAIAVLPVSQKHRQAALVFERACSGLVEGRAWLCDWDAPLAAKVARAKEAGWLRIAVVGSKEAQAAAESSIPRASIGGVLVSAEEACAGMAWQKN